MDYFILSLIFEIFENAHYIGINYAECLKATNIPEM
jgi:hypothetical protein